jgi:CBS domain-containing protein
MPISEICNREVVIVQRDTTASEAAQLMRQHHVGEVEIMAPAIDQMAVTVGDIMASELATVKENAGVFETIEYMRAKGVRRVPVVDKGGGLVGILALDDLLELLAEELLALAKLVRHEQKKEIQNRR